MTDPFPHVRACLQTWTFAAWDILQHAVNEVRINPHRANLHGGDVIGSWSRPPEHLWPDSIESGPLYIPEWYVAVQAMQSDPVIRMQFEAVGTALGKGGFGVNEIGFAMWPTPRLIAHWRSGHNPVDLRESVFDELYRPISAFLAATEIEYAILIPLAGLIVTGGPIHLGEDIEIDRLSDDEIAEFLERRLLVDEFGASYSRERLPEYLRYGLRHRLRTAKIVGSTAIDFEENARLRLTPVQDRRRIGRAIAVVVDGRVVPQTFIAKQVGWSPTGGSTASPQLTYPYAYWATTKAILDASDTEIARRSWDVMGNAAFDEISALRIAVDRVAGLSMRPSDDDVTIDLAIAAEAFFRAGDMEKRSHGTGEMVATRAASYIDGRALSMDSEDVGNFFGAAKRIRNGLVHRGEFDTTLLPQAAGGGRMAHSEFNEHYEMLMRRALQRALRDPDAPKAPIWPPL